MDRARDFSTAGSKNPTPATILSTISITAISTTGPNIVSVRAVSEPNLITGGTLLSPPNNSADIHADSTVAVATATI